MTTLTLLTLVVIAYGVAGRRGYVRALALGGSTAAGAALVAGGTAVPTFYAVAMGAAVGVFLGTLRCGPLPATTRRRLPPGGAMLVVFFAWAVLVTVVAPFLFDGLPVLSADGSPRVLGAGTVTTSNLAQIVYLALGLCVFVVVARSPFSGPELIGLAAGLTTVLSAWRYLSDLGVPFPSGVFDNSPAFAYVETDVGGAERFRGILSEPAGLALSSLVTASYMFSRAVRVRGSHRVGVLSVAGLAVLLGAVSTSATFVVAGMVLLVIAGLWLGLGFVLRRSSFSAVSSVLLCLVVIAALWFLPLATAFVQTTIDDKVSSSSFEDRGSSDTGSYDIFFDTYGVGAGLGSTRGSSFVPSLLSTVGIPGTLLFGLVVVGLIVRAASVREYRPVVWALAALLVVKIISGPDLSDSSGILWLSLGLLARACDAPREPPDEQFLHPRGSTWSGPRRPAVGAQDIGRRGQRAGPPVGVGGPDQGERWSV